MMSRAANLKNSDFKSRFPESLAATQLASHVEVEHEVKLSENRRAVTVIHHPGRRGVTVTVTAAAAETDTVPVTASQAGNLKAQAAQGGAVSGPEGPAEGYIYLRY